MCIHINLNLSDLLREKCEVFSNKREKEEQPTFRKGSNGSAREEEQEKKNYNQCYKKEASWGRKPEEGILN